MARIPYVEEKDHPELASDITKIKEGARGEADQHLQAAAALTDRLHDVVRAHRRDPLGDKAFAEPA